MSKVFVIPDVHLKPGMITRATEIVADGDYDRIVILGDLVDDFNQQRNVELYKKTFETIFEFINRYPDTMYCYGNHDVSYLFRASETGYSTYAERTVIDGMTRLISLLRESNVGYIHRIDNVLFSHGGLTERFVKRCFGYGPRLDIDDMISRINRLQKKDIWRGDSPIWARPQYGEMRLYPMDMMQVVGHTPVEKPLLEDKLLTTDTFSTHWDGTPIGNMKFVWIDTVKEEFYEVG